MLTRRVHLYAIASFVFVGFSMIGCGGSPAPAPAKDDRPKVTISGTVTVDGKNIDGEEVFLTLHPADGSSAVSIPLNRDGTFKGEAISGKCYVSITAGRSVEAGHSEGKTLGIGALFLSPESPLEIEAKEGATATFEVGKAAAATSKKRPMPGAPSPGSAHAQ